MINIEVYERYKGEKVFFTQCPSCGDDVTFFEDNSPVLCSLCKSELEKYDDLIADNNARVDYYRNRLDTISK